MMSLIDLSELLSHRKYYNQRGSSVDFWSKTKDHPFDQDLKGQSAWKALEVQAIHEATGNTWAASAGGCLVFRLHWLGFNWLHIGLVFSLRGTHRLKWKCYGQSIGLGFNSTGSISLTCLNQWLGFTHVYTGAVQVASAEGLDYRLHSEALMYYKAYP